MCPLRTECARRSRAWIDMTRPAGIFVLLAVHSGVVQKASERVKATRSALSVRPVGARDSGYRLFLPVPSVVDD